MVRRCRKQAMPSSLAAHVLAVPEILKLVLDHAMLNCCESTGTLGVNRLWNETAKARLLDRVTMRDDHFTTSCWRSWHTHTVTLLLAREPVLFRNVRQLWLVSGTATAGYLPPALKGLKYATGLQSLIVNEAIVGTVSFYQPLLPECLPMLNLLRLTFSNEEYTFEQHRYIRELVASTPKLETLDLRYRSGHFAHAANQVNFPITINRASQTISALQLNVGNMSGELLVHLGRQ